MLLSRRILPRLLLGGAIGSLPGLGRAQSRAAHRLTLLHVNDFHSRHEPVDPRNLTCAAGDGCYGGSARLAAAIREQRAAAQADGRRVLLLDGGDQFQGSLFFTAHAGMAELAVQHAVGTDAMTLGNHEFDRGPDTLGRYIHAARFPILASNIDASADPDLRERILPWALLDAGLPVGVVGLTTLETAITSSPGDKVRFLDPAAALAGATQAVRAAGARMIVVLSHLGIDADIALPAQDVALIIGGHSHTLLSNTEPGARGPAPTAGMAPIVQAGCYGRYLGRVDLDLLADGTVLALAAACRHVGLDLVPDPEVAAIVARFAAPLEEVRNRPVATLDAPLDTANCRIAPCRLGGMVATSMRAAARGPGGMPVVGLMNAGGMRVGLPAGSVTLGQILDTMPFGNTLATATVTGTDLIELVRHGLSMTGRGGYPQWAGLRLTGLTIEVEHDGTWSAIDPTARYLVATNSFLRSGGDGYAVLRDRGQDAYDTGPGVADLFAQSLAGPSLARPAGR